MPKVARRSIAANERLTRNARPVFGDVSNNAKGRQSSNADKAKGASNSNHVEDASINRRRSSRLSGIEPDETTIAIALPTTRNPRASTKQDEPEIANERGATRQTRQSRGKAEKDTSLSIEIEGPTQKGTHTSTRATRGSKVSQVELANPSIFPSGLLEKPTNETKATVATEVASASNGPEEQTNETGKLPARKLRSSTDEEGGQGAIQEKGKLPARETRSRKEPPPPSEMFESRPVRSRKTYAESKAIKNEPTERKTRSRSLGEAPAPEARKTRSSRGRAAKSSASDEGTMRRARSSSRAAVATKAKTVSRKSNGKTKAASKAGSKRERGGGEPQQPRKSARVRRSKSNSVPASRATPCADFLKNDDFRLFRGDLVEVPFDASKFTCGIAPADLPNKGKVEEVPEYVTDIMQRLFDREVSSRPHPYINSQPTLNPNMRAILVDWLVEVHMKFRLEASTLYLCVNIIDRYLEREVVERSRLQLVGVTSLLVACKIEEIFPPEVRDCVYICDRAYSREEVLEMETMILRTLQYKVSTPTGYPFLVRFLQLTKATKLQGFAANYYFERMLQEYAALKHRPSLVAACCVVLALNHRSIRAHDGLFGGQPGVPKNLLEYTGFEFAKILEVCDKVCKKVQNTQVTNSRRELIAVKRKYESNRYMLVASDFADPTVQDIRDAYR